MKSILRNTKAKEVNLMKEVSSNDRKTYLYLVLELPPKRLHIKRCRIVLGKSIEVVHTADLIVVIAQHEDNLEVSVAKVHAFTCKYIDSTERVPESVTQIQKYFSKEEKGQYLQMCYQHMIKRQKG